MISQSIKTAVRSSFWYTVNLRLNASLSDYAQRGELARGQTIALISANHVDQFSHTAVEFVGPLDYRENVLMGVTFARDRVCNIRPQVGDDHVALGNGLHHRASQHRSGELVPLRLRETVGAQLPASLLGGHR